MDEWIRIEEAAEILGLSTSGVFYRKSIGLLECRRVRQGSFQWNLFRRSQCEEHAKNPPSYLRHDQDLPEVMPRWSAVELAQLATFIDCEGNIAIHRQGPHSKHAQKSASYSLRLNVANTYYPVIHGLQQRFGGNIQFQDRTRTNPGWKPHYRWWVGASYALLLLELAEPYFQIKQEEVALAIAFQRRLNTYIAGRPRQSVVEPSETAWRQEQMDRLKALKHRTVGHWDWIGPESCKTSPDSDARPVSYRRDQVP